MPPKTTKNGPKKLSTKNILYYYNYYFHVPIKKGLRVGYARVHAHIATDATDRYAVSVSRYTKATFAVSFWNLGCELHTRGEKRLEKRGIFFGFL